MVHSFGCSGALAGGGKRSGPCSSSPHQHPTPEGLLRSPSHPSGPVPGLGAARLRSIAPTLLEHEMTAGLSEYNWAPVKRERGRRERGETRETRAQISMREIRDEARQGAIRELKVCAHNRRAAVCSKGCSLRSRECTSETGPALRPGIRHTVPPSPFPPPRSVRRPVTASDHRHHPGG